MKFTRRMLFVLTGYAFLVHVSFWGVLLGEFESFARYVVFTIVHMPASLVLEGPLSGLIESWGWAAGSWAHMWLSHSSCLILNLLLLWVGMMLIQSLAIRVWDT